MEAIYPVVIFSFDEPKRAQAQHYCVTFPDLKVLEFQFAAIQLNRLIPILSEDAPIVQEIKNEPPRAPSTPRRNKKLRDLAQLHKETV